MSISKNSKKLKSKKIINEIERCIMSDKEKKVPFRFGMGTDLLDAIVGGGLGLGIPSGKIINIVGDKSSGKTFLACEIVANAFHAYGEKFNWVYDDCESGFTFDTKHLYNFKIMPDKIEDRTRSITVEQLHGNVRKYLDSLKPDEFGIYVVDSLDGAKSEQINDRIEKRYTKFKKGEQLTEGSYQMDKAKFLSQEFFPDIAGRLEKKNALLIIISQVRDNVDPNPFAKKQTRAGGKALDFYCHTVLWLAQLAKIAKTVQNQKKVIGAVVKTFSEKSKTPRPYRSALFDLYFDHGFDNIGSSLNYLFDLRGDSGKLLDKAKNIIWKGVETKVASLKEFIIDHKWDEDFRKEYKEYKKSDMIDWLEKNHKEAYENHFGVPMDREELIEYIETKGLEKELRERVINKWEEIEEAIKPKRKPKYRK